MIIWKKHILMASISIFIKELSATRNRDVNCFWESFSVQETFSWAKSSRKLFNWQYLTEIFHTEPLRGLHIYIHAIYSYTHRQNYCQEQSPKGWWARISWSLQQAPKQPVVKDSLEGTLHLKLSDFLSSLYLSSQTIVMLEQISLSLIKCVNAGRNEGICILCRMTEVYNT